MPTPKKGTRLGGSPAHQRLILANLASQLFEHGAVRTTEAKARLLRPHAEKLITKAKKGDLHNRREVLKTITDKSVVHTLFTEIGPMFAERPGGYTRITKLGPRKGDNAPMAIIELVTEEFTPSTGGGSVQSGRAAAPVDEAPAPSETETAEAEAIEAESADADVTEGSESSELPGTPGNPVQVDTDGEADAVESPEGGVDATPEDADKQD